MKKFMTVIADDEPLARERIVSLLEDEPDFEIAAECKNGSELIRFLAKNDVDLMFLDIQMPKLDGFAALREIEPRHLPLVIITTAFEDYALKAFDVNAVDYLLKPFDRKRFKSALDRIRERLDSKEFYSSKLFNLISTLPERIDFPEKISVKTGEKIIFLPVNEIEWIESDANYIRLYTKGKTYQIRETMNTFQSKVNPKLFIRIHRSTMVNFDFVKELEPWFNDNYIVILKDGTKLSVGRTYRKNVTSLFPV